MSAAASGTVRTRRVDPETISLPIGALIWGASDNKPGFIVAVVIELDPVFGRFDWMMSPVRVSYVGEYAFTATWCRSWLGGRAAATFGGVVCL